MKNLRKAFPQSTRVKFTNSTGSTITSGSVVDLGWTYGVTVNDVLDGNEGLVETRGKFQLPKVAATAFTAGQAVGWDGSEVVVAGGGRPIGVVVEDAASSDATIMVALNESAEFFAGKVVGDASGGLEVDLGFGKIPAGVVIVQSSAVSGEARTLRPLTSWTALTGGDAGKISIVTSAGAATDEHHIYATRE